MSEQQADRSAQEVSFDILREMYSEAEPPLDFDDIQENPDEYPNDWYENHYLNDERQREILDKHLERANLSEREESGVTFTTILHYGPTGVKENVQ